MDAHIRPSFGQKVDLHCHSSASDGQLAPTELVRAAAAAGVDILALTDHDTLDGIVEASHAATAYGITMVPGVEISTRWQQHTIHIVGLDFDPHAPLLVSGLQHLQLQRYKRATVIAGKLERLGVTEALTRTAEEAETTQITRTHFGRLLVASGRCRSLREAFKRYLNPGRPAYAACEWVPMMEALVWIAASGGFSVLAHPLKYQLATADRTRLIEAFRDAGGHALEVCSGRSTPAAVSLCVGYARRYSLLGSVGSDYHGDEQRRVTIGCTPPLPASVDPVWSHFGHRTS